MTAGRFRSDRLARPLPLLVALTVALVPFALLRGIDHDESQYVAAARLVASGLLPYRDFAYLQTPLQPFAFAPIAWAFGGWAWPALRIANALLGVVVVAASWRAMCEAGVAQRTATPCAALLAACDILLFSAGTARNDALPAAMLACALVPMLRADRGAGSRGGALLVGLLLAGAAAAKLSYAVAAVAYGVHALIVRRHRPGWVLIGALPVVAFVAASAAAAPMGCLFGTLTFPMTAPHEYYAVRPWKLGGVAKLADMLKFLALGPALLALAAVGVRGGPRRPTLLDWLILAGFVAALLPSPTWRQYLLPMLPPLFVRLALVWQAQPPGRTVRVAGVVCACAGLAPTVEAILAPAGITAAMRESRAIAAALDTARFDGRIATLSPQFVPATGRGIDPRFATGPFYFRSRRLLTLRDEVQVHVVGRRTMIWHFRGMPPQAILVGGEGAWTSGDAALDALLEGWATAHRWQRLPLASDRFRLYLPPQAATVSRPAIAAR